MKKKGATRKKKAPVAMTPFEYEAPLAMAEPPSYVRCRICNVALSHLNFEWPAVPTDLTLSLVKEAIRQRHRGTAYQLALWLNSVQPHAALHNVDDSTTLKQLGVVGMMSGDVSLLPTVAIHYDFQPALHDDPVASIEPIKNQSSLRTGIPVDIKAYIRAQKAAIQGPLSSLIQPS